MKKLFVVMGLASMLVSGNALAQIDPDDDGIGMYFDPDATVYCGPASPGTPFSAYLVLSNASAAEGVHGWELMLQYNSGSIFVLATLFNGQAINALTPPEYGVGIATPLPWAPAITLATFTLMTLTPLCEWFYVTPIFTPSIPGAVVYADGADPGNLIPMQQVTGGPDTAVFGINCDCPPPIGVEDQTWGGVKAMYK